MRFWRRSRPHRHSRTSNIDDSQETNNVSIPNGNHLRWNPFYRVSRSGRFHPFHSTINPFLHGTQEHVPKCLALVSHSDILMGRRVENFSAECWLQNHLHQFAHTSANEVHINNIETAEEAEESEDVDDDSPVGSDMDRRSYSSLDSCELESDDREEENGRPGDGGPPDIFNYTVAIELPPYHDEPPPSYEEAVAEDERRERLHSSTRSRDAFLW
ncbi:uncharacterized protein LOC111134710 [Crassostrea virginica]